MYNLKNKDRSQIYLKKIIFSSVFLVVVSIIFLISTISTLRIYLQSRKLRQERKEKEKILEAEERKNFELKQKVAEIETPEGIEKNIREKLQIKKPGEEVVVILNPKNETENNNKNENNFVNRFFGWIFK